MSKESNADEMLEQGVGILIKGFSSMVRSPKKLGIFALAVLVCRYITVHQADIIAKYSIESPVPIGIIVWILPLVLLAGFAGSAPKSWDEKFEEIGFKNRKGNYPQLIKRKKVKTGKGPVEELVFDSPGIPLSRWVSDMEEMETVFDGIIVEVTRFEESRRRVLLKMVSGRSIPNMVNWDDKYIPQDDFVLMAGIGLVEDVYFDFNEFPHALIAGQTGSGKSVVLRCLAWQCVKKGAKLYAVDFKGGVEFQSWEEAGVADVVYDEEAAMLVMNHLQQEMRERLDLFRKEHVKKISEYNAKHPEAPLCRIVLICDEVAEMLDMEGLSKEDKKEKEALSQAMASLARLSRAAGINMLLGMQRPDAKVLKGQIKNNTPIRISGKFSDAVASDIVLGNAGATELQGKGRMMFSIGAGNKEFQGFWFDDKRDLKPGNYQVGVTLNKAPLGTPTEPIGENEFKEFEVPAAEIAEWDWMDFGTEG